jgi:PAS domain-containing protein
LREPENTYRSLFEHMMNSVVHARMIFDGNQPVDLEYLAANPAFAAVTGITVPVVGHKISEIIPDYCQNNPESLATFGEVARTGVARRWEHYLPELDRWFSFMIYSPKLGDVVIISENITQRKQAELALQQQAAELESRNAELERFNRAMVGRELAMIALKQQVNALSQQLGQTPPYALAFLDVVSGENTP